MKSQDLFSGMEYIDDKFIQQAEFGEFSKERFYGTGRKRPRIRRVFLLAAVIALGSLLAGCGISYLLHLNNLKVGSQEIVYHAWNEDLTEFREETATQHVLTLSGLKGTANYQAAQEWFAFRESYDPDWSIHSSVWDNMPDFGPSYQFYQPYSQEMVDKIDEISQKYGLKLIGPEVDAWSGKSLFAYLGLDGIFLPDAPAAARHLNPSYYENGYFEMDFLMQMDSGDNRWPYDIMLSYFYSKKDCFNTRNCALSTSLTWQEQNYTTAAGDQVMILRAPEGGMVWVFCDTQDAMISLRMEDSHFEDRMTDDQLRQVLDCIDFTPNLQPGDPALLQGLPTNNLPTDPVQMQNGNTLALKSALTDGTRTYITLGVTVPEGVDARRLSFGVCNLVPQIPVEDASGHNFTTYTLEDGDGLDHTADLVVQWDCRNAEQMIFQEDSTWTLYLEDLQIETWDGAYTTLWNGGGIWKFQIVFDNTSDYRELSFVDKPVTLPLAIGWTVDGEDVYEDVPILALTLRSFGGKVTFPREYMGADMCDYANERYPLVFLKDGTSIALDSQLEIMDNEKKATPIPLDEVVCIQLIDGTKLYPLGIT